MDNHKMLSEALNLIDRISRDIGKPVTIRAGMGEYYPDRFYSATFGGAMMAAGTDIENVISDLSIPA